MVDMKGNNHIKIKSLSIDISCLTDVMVLNDIIEQAAGQQSVASEHGGKTNIS